MASSSSLDNDLSLVYKLNKKIKDAEYMKEEKLLKILNTLLCLNMTLDILQKTHIGVTVNPLRKVEGKVGEKAKELVKKWKKLLPDKSKPVVTDNSQGISENSCSSSSAVDHLSPPRPSTGRSLYNKRSLSPAVPNSGNNRSRQGPTSTVNDVYNVSTPADGSHCRMAKSPKPHSSEITDHTTEQGRKRKNEDDSNDREESVVAASTKRSRTQVYSGKSAGLKYVPSLFDTCMNILTDNIDAIEEVGGVPFFILEPVLSKCSPTQLMRLEEFNPHFIEDSDGLWEKHVLKEFKGVKPSRGTTWRDLYIRKIEERERKMKSITSVIRARQQAREEPVRKAAILNSTPLPPARQRRGFYSRNSPSSSSTDHHPGSNLMKQTMKMAKNRQMMMAARNKR